MRHVKKYDFGEWMMYSHLPEIKNERVDKASIYALAIIAGAFYTYFEFSGAADNLTTYVANIISFII